MDKQVDMEIRLGKRVIGDDQPAFVVAEIGNNHNGDIELARRLIDQAVACGADAVKFQVKDIELAFPQELLDSPYIGPHSFGTTYREHKQYLEFSHQEYRELCEYAQHKGTIWFATPFDTNSMAFLASLDVPVVKVASFHVEDYNLLQAVGEYGRPVFLSTGMSSLAEIDRAVEILDKYDVDVVVMHCVSAYPTDDRDVNLAVIPMLKERYKRLVGYSGHERGISIAASSVLFGARVVEKHFTLDRYMKGPDQASSLEPKGLRALVERIRLLEDAVGKPEKKILPCELATRRKAGRSV